MKQVGTSLCSGDSLHPTVEPLGEYWSGRVVQCKNRTEMIGHIISFYRTNASEIGINVKWIDGTESHIHHGNLILH